MIVVDSAQMTTLAETMFVRNINDEFGTEGIDVMRSILVATRRFHHAVATERITSQVVIISRFDDAPVCRTPPARFQRPEQMTAWYVSGPVTVQLVGDELLVWPEIVDWSGLTGRWIAYHYQAPSLEFLRTPAGLHAVPSIGAPSFLGLAYYRDLRDALIRYSNICVRHSQCDFIRDSWRDSKRLVFVPGPEIYMRRSLHRYLQASIRGYQAIELMPEQNVDETHPVDIKVTWSSSNRVALIEIKWLGKSAARSSTHFTQQYYDQRARDGARQLADYLDKYHVASPEHEARGYLAVYDGRRRNVRADSIDLPIMDATHYRLREIEYDDGILNRSDFDQPIRFFCEPHMA